MAPRAAEAIDDDAPHDPDIIEPGNSAAGAPTHANRSVIATKNATARTVARMAARAARPGARQGNGAVLTAASRDVGGRRVRDAVDHIKVRAARARRLT